jgi:hypothetical protein
MHIKFASKQLSYLLSNSLAQIEMDDAPLFGGEAPLLAGGGGGTVLSVEPWQKPWGTVIRNQIRNQPERNEKKCNQQEMLDLWLLPNISSRTAYVSCSNCKPRFLLHTLLCKNTCYTFVLHTPCYTLHVTHSYTLHTCGTKKLGFLQEIYKIQSCRTPQERNVQVLHKVPPGMGQGAGSQGYHSCCNAIWQAILWVSQASCG